MFPIKLIKDALDSPRGVSVKGLTMLLKTELLELIANSPIVGFRKKMNQSEKFIVLCFFTFVSTDYPVYHEIDMLQKSN